MKVLAIVAIAMFLPLMLASTASAAPPITVDLLTASPFAILAGDHLTNVPTSTIAGNVGLSPAAGSFITGLTCTEITGTLYAVDATGPLCATNNPGLLTTAMNNLTTAYNDAAGRLPDTTYITADNQLGGQTLVPGVYRFGHATTANLIGNLTLSGDADAVWIFQATSDLVFAAASTVTFNGYAQACHVFWQVGSDTTLHSTASIRGTILSFNDIVVDDAVTVEGRLLAAAQAPHAGRVTLIHDTITAPAACVTQASIDSTNAAAAAAAAAQAQAAAEAQAAADRAAAAKVIADKAAADKIIADKLAAQVAEAASISASLSAAQAVKTAKAAQAAQAAAVKAKLARIARVKAAQKAIARKRAAVRAASTSAAFTG
jgi:hypothetical protein